MSTSQDKDIDDFCFNLGSTYGSDSQDLPGDLSILEDILHELAKGRAEFPPESSAHGAWAIIKEELDELWDEVKINPKKRMIDPGGAIKIHKEYVAAQNIEHTRRLRAEAVQVAATTIRFISGLDEGRF